MAVTNCVEPINCHVREMFCIEKQNTYNSAADTRARLLGWAGGVDPVQVLQNLNTNLISYVIVTCVISADT